MAQRKPDPRLSVVMTSPDGSGVTWDANARRPEDRPTDISFRSERGSGFLDGGCTLSRRVDNEDTDTASLNETQFFAADGSVAYEGSLTAAPRSVDTAHSISPSFVGPIALAQDRTFSQVYLDHRFSSWGDAPIAEQVAAFIGSVSYGADFNWTNGGDGLICALPTTALGAQTVAEAWYIAPDGVLIQTVMYAVADTTMPAGYEGATLFASSDDHRTTAESYALTADGAVHTQVLTTSRGYLMVRVYSNGNARTPAAGSSRRYSNLVAVGDHGLTLRDNGTDPQALWLSDILKDVFNRYAPQIDTSGVQQNTTLIEQAVYESQFPHDAALDLNKYALWELGVWEDKRLQFEPADLTDYDWEVRLGVNATTTLQGDDAKNLRNGIVVEFTEAGSGKARTLTPDNYDELRDDSVENPANQWGRTKWGEPLSLSAPCTENMAIAAGQQKLAEDNAPKEAGDITIVGHVRDRAGHWRPAHEMRAGQTVALLNFPNPRPRRIASTNYSGNGYTQSLSVDNTEQTAEAFLDFYGAALGARNAI